MGLMTAAIAAVIRMTFVVVVMAAKKDETKTDDALEPPAPTPLMATLPREAVSDTGAALALLALNRAARPVPQITPLRRRLERSSFTAVSSWRETVDCFTPACAAISCCV